jgi:putative transposase
VILSVSRKGECWDNAVAESFFATIKRELINDRAWPTRAGLHQPSITSKAGTTPGGSIPPSATSAQPNTSQPTTGPPDRRHDQLKKPVCQSGASPQRDIGTLGHASQMCALLSHYRR